MCQHHKPEACDVNLQYIATKLSGPRLCMQEVVCSIQVSSMGFNHKLSYQSISITCVSSEK